MKRLLVSFILLSQPTMAFAHAGDHADKAINHFLGQPFHAFPIIAIIGVVAYQLAKRTRSKKD